jgi:hypothetical protein
VIGACLIIHLKAFAGTLYMEMVITRATSAALALNRRNKSSCRQEIQLVITVMFHDQLQILAHNKK